MILIFLHFESPDLLDCFVGHFAIGQIFAFGLFHAITT